MVGGLSDLWHTIFVMLVVATMAGIGVAALAFVLGERWEEKRRQELEERRRED